MRLPRTVFLIAMALLAPDLAAQEADYYQTATDDFGRGADRHANSGNSNNYLVIDRLPANFRVPVRTTPDQPVSFVYVRGARDVYCALQGAGDSTPTDYITKKTAGTRGELDFQRLLYEKLAGLDAGTMQIALQRIAKADRATAYRELFGVDLPPLTGEWSFTVNKLRVAEPQQMALNLGREARVELPAVICATPAQVDAAIATAKQVYAAVISAMQTQGRKR
jgi:hypothetical protein